MYMIFEKNFNEILVSTNKDLLDINVIHHYLAFESYWAKDIPLSVVETAINNSLCFGVYKNNLQIGFARVITDFATFGYLADVFIIDTERGKGYSNCLMHTIHEHPSLQNLRRLLLTTRDAHSLYKKFNWEEVGEVYAKKIMQLHKPNVYES